MMFDKKTTILKFSCNWYNYSSVFAISPFFKKLVSYWTKTLDLDIRFSMVINKQSFADVLQNRCSLKVLQILQKNTFLKKDTNTGVFLWNFQKC